MSELPKLHSAPCNALLNDFLSTRTSVEIDSDATRHPEDSCLVDSKGVKRSFHQIVDPDELRERLAKHQIRVPEYWRISDVNEIQDAGIGNSSVNLRVGSYCRYVQFAADAGLRYNQLSALSDRKTGIVERPESGSAHWVMGLVEDGAVTFQSVVDLRWLNEVFQFPMHLECPSVLEEADQAKLLKIAGQVVEAIELLSGPFRIECLLCEDGHAVVTEVDTGWFNQAMPVDLFALAGVEDFWSMQCRALGIEVVDAEMISRCVSLQWLYSRSGIVEEIRGVEDALASPGVDAVQIHAQAGMTLGHVIDVVSRDALGFVVATGETRKEADAHCAAGSGSIMVLRRTIL